MAYPFVKSFVDLGRASGPRKAIAWHMAEGGGTVGYLAKANPNGVSVHFVIPYSGNIVQMLELSHMHSSIRVTAIRTTDDAPYDWYGGPVTYGATAAKGVLGDWWKNPNNASIGVEVEGFARDGPNAMQRGAIGRLWNDMRGRYGDIRSLGHRDFADYKGCPGRRFPWDVVGGHGPFTTSGGDVPAIAVTPDGTIYAYIVRVAEDAVTYGPTEGQRGKVSAGFVGNALGPYIIDGIGERAYRIGNSSMVLEKDCSAEKNERDTAIPTPTPETHTVTLVIDDETVYTEALT